jgi:glycosyltransferase involved in cell wall biosynthesis
MSTSPPVSVVIPTRDRRAFVLEAVASVLAQRGCDCEVIVVDDGSEDGTAAALEGLGSRVRCIRQPAAGVSAARNHGARLARGEWLAFLDSDDLWKPGKLAAQLAFHQREPTVPVSHTEETWVRDGVRVNPCRHHSKPEGDIFLPSLRRCLVSPSAVMIRRVLFEQAGGFDESLPVCEDYDLWLRLSLRVPIGLIHEPLVVKRGGHADQLSRRHWGMDRFRVAALARLLAEQPMDEPRRAAAADVLREKCAILAQGARRRGRADEAERYLALARHAVESSSRPAAPRPA